MKEESDDIDKIFRDKFADAPAPENMESWASVQGKLQRKGFTSGGSNSPTNIKSNSMFKLFVFTMLMFSLSVLVKDSFRLTRNQYQNLFISQATAIDELHISPELPQPGEKEMLSNELKSNQK